MGTNPLKNIIDQQLSALDFAVLSHGLAPHGRDYIFVIQDSIGPTPGTYSLTLTHVVELDYKSNVSEDAWRRSWDDVLTNYQDWEKAGAPEGYVRGTNWSLAYPGIEVFENSPDAAEWSKKLGQSMHAMSLTTDRFRARIIFHDARLSSINSDTGILDKVIFTL